MSNVLEANTVSVFAMATQAVSFGSAETASGWLAHEAARVLAKLECNVSTYRLSNKLWTVKVHDLGALDRRSLLTELVELKWGAAKKEPKVFDLSDVVITNASVHGVIIELGGLAPHENEVCVMFPNGFCDWYKPITLGLVENDMTAKLTREAVNEVLDRVAVEDEEPVNDSNGILEAELLDKISEAFNADDLVSDIAGDLSTRSVLEVVEDWIDDALKESERAINEALAITDDDLYT